MSSAVDREPIGRNAYFRWHKTCLLGWALLILQPFHHFTYVTTHSPTLLLLYLCHSSFSNSSIPSPMSQHIPQPSRRFTYISAHSPTLPLLHLRHSSFSNPSLALPTPQLILQPFHCFTCVTTHSPTLLLLYLCHSSFSNSSIASPTSQLILQPFCRFTYVTAHSPTLPLLHLCHSSFSNPSFASPMSQALHLIHLASRPCHDEQRSGWLSVSAETIAKVEQEMLKNRCVTVCELCEWIPQPVQHGRRVLWQGYTKSATVHAKVHRSQQWLLKI